MDYPDYQGLRPARAWWCRLPVWSQMEFHEQAWLGERSSVSACFLPFVMPFSAVPRPARPSRTRWHDGMAWSFRYASGRSWGADRRRPHLCVPVLCRQQEFHRYALYLSAFEYGWKHHCDADLIPWRLLNTMHAQTHGGLPNPIVFTHLLTFHLYPHSTVRAILLSTPMKASPAPAKTAKSCAVIRTS
jgi:hypothetical protein